MGVLADFYVSTEAEAPLYDERQELPETDVASYNMVTPLELSMLWAILQGREWQVEMLNEFQCLLQRDGGERLIHRFPDAMVGLLAVTTDDVVAQVAPRWAAIEELCWPPAAALPVLRDLRRLAERARETGRSLYVWNCM